MACVSLQDWWRLRHSWMGDKGFDTLFALTTWEIWKERNARVFRRDSLTVHQLVMVIKQQGELGY